MDTTYDVRVWSIQENVGARGKTYCRPVEGG
jgi:hypothetical protein